MNDNEVTVWGALFVLIFACVLGTAVIHGCNENDLQNHKFQLQKLQIERNCPEVKK